MFPSQPRDIISPACSWSAPGSPPRWTFSKHLLRDTSRRSPDQKPRTTLTGSSQLRGEVAPLWASHGCPSSKPYLCDWAQPPCKGSSFQRLVFTISSFRLLPRAHDHRWELEQRLTCKLKALSSGSALSSLQQTTSVSTSLLMLLQSICQTPVPFSPNSWTRPWDIWTPPLGEVTLPWHRMDNPPFSDWDHSHFTFGCASATWRWLFDEANRTTSSANSRNGIQRPPNLTPSTTWLHLEILSMKIMNRTGDNEQRWWRPTLTGNGSNLLPAMQTKLCVQQYRGWMYHNKRPSTLYS